MFFNFLSLAALYFDNDVLKYSTSLGRYVPQAASAISVASANIQELNNVTVDVGLAVNQVLKWNGSNWLNGNVAFSEITGKPTTLASYGITDALKIGDDYTGSVFADNSTLLVDGVSGTINSSALTMPIQIPDGSISSNYIGFGADDDLKIFHNGNHSIIRETGTGNLYLQSDNNVILGSDSGTETYAKGIYNGAVELYHDNVKKLETTANGITVEGSVTSNFIGSVFADDSSQMLDAETQTLYGTIVATAGTAPTVSGQPGAVGEIRFDDNYIYVKTSGAGWKRAALSGLV